MSWTHHKRPHKRKRVNMDEHKASRDALDAFIQQYNPRYIIGIDEVGWGAIAGPIAVGCCVYETAYRNAKLKDSKRYTTEKARQKAAELVTNTALHYQVMFRYPGEIETLGPATCLQDMFLNTAQNAVNQYPDSIVVLDGSNLVKGLHHPQIALPKADAVCPTVSAASIYAKVTRDKYMNDLHPEFVEFDWYANKGYPTQKHIALLKHGVTKHHRLNIQLVLDAQKKFGDYKEITGEEEAVG